MIIFKTIMVFITILFTLIYVDRILNTEEYPTTFGVYAFISSIIYTIDILLFTNIVISCQ